MEVLYWMEFFLVILLSIFLIYFYAHKNAAFYAKSLVFSSFLASLICFVILPIDIYQSSLEQSQTLNAVRYAWLIIYYINFFLCWLLLPFAQQYEDSGEFTFLKKLKQSLVLNGIIVGVLCGTVLVFVIYLLLFSSFTSTQLPSLFATLVNVFGLTLVSILLGYGLISFPKQCFLRRDYKRLVNQCHRSAQSLKTQEQTILEQIFSIKQLINKNDDRDTLQKRYLCTLIQQNFKFQNFRNYQDQNATTNLKKKSTADLHKIVKKRILQKNACQNQLDELVADLKSTTESYLNNNYSRKKIYYTFLFCLTTAVSVLIFFAELATFAKFLAPINLLSLMSWGGEVAFIFNTCLTAYVAYIITHTIFRIKVYKVFSLHKGHSTASSLLFTAINLARVCYPLCYNVLQITNMPSSSFLTFFGQVTIREQFTIIFPILMLLFAVVNLFDIYDTIMGYLGLGSYAFDEEQAQQKKQEGRSILIQRFKQLNIRNNQLEMIHLL